MLVTRLCVILVLLPLAVSGLSIALPQDPCKQWYLNENTCNDTEVCRLVKVQCFTTPCEPQPQCVSVESAPKGGCDYGDPVIDPSGNIVPCSGCPDTTECVGDSTVCCWQPPPPPKWPLCLLFAYTCPPGTECVEIKKNSSCTDNDCELVHNCTTVGDPCAICKINEQCLPTPCTPESPPSSCFACVAAEDPCEKCQANEECLPTLCTPGSPPSSCYGCRAAEDPCEKCKINEQCLPTPCTPESPPSSCFACVAAEDPCEKCQIGEECLPTPCPPGSPPSSCYACGAVEDPCKKCKVGEECLATPCLPTSPPSSCFACVATDPCKKCQENEKCVPTSCAAGSPPSACYACVGATEKPGSCPPIEPGFGICPVECGNDSECPGSKKCCKAQCGIFCTEPFVPEPMPYPCFLVVI